MVAQKQHTTTITVEADTVEGAEQHLRQQVPSGLALLSTKTIRSGRPVVLTAAGDTLDDAFEKAAAMAPVGAVISDRKALMNEAVDLTLSVKARDDAAATAEALRDPSLNCAACRDSAFVKAVTPTGKGRAGFFGIGFRPNVYEVVVRQRAVAQVTAKEKARVEGVIGRKGLVECPRCNAWVDEGQMSPPLTLQAEGTGRQVHLGPVCPGCWEKIHMSSSSMRWG